MRFWNVCSICALYIHSYYLNTHAKLSVRVWPEPSSTPICVCELCRLCQVCAYAQAWMSLHWSPMVLYTHLIVYSKIFWTRLLQIFAYTAHDIPVVGNPFRPWSECSTRSILIWIYIFAIVPHEFYSRQNCKQLNSQKWLQEDKKCHHLSYIWNHQFSFDVVYCTIENQATSDQSYRSLWFHF